MEIVQRASESSNRVIPATEVESVEDVTSGRPSLLEDPRSKRILAKTIYRELRESGVEERDVLAIATELLGLVADELRAS